MFHPVEPFQVLTRCAIHSWPNFLNQENRPGDRAHRKREAGNAQVWPMKKKSLVQAVPVSYRGRMGGS